MKIAKDFSKLARKFEISDDGRIISEVTETSLFTSSGYIGKLGSERAILYRNNSGLYLLLESLDRRIPIGDDRTSSRFERFGEVSRLIISLDNREIMRAEYNFMRLPPMAIAYDITPFHSDEDDDFGLFLHNVISDHARASRVFNNS